MADPIKMLDVEKVPLGILPRLTNGKINTKVDPVWKSSDDAQVGIERQPSFEYDDGANGLVTIPEGYYVYATTPLESGAATVSVSGTGYPDESIDLSYAAGAVGALNLSAGAPVSDV